MNKLLHALNILQDYTESQRQNKERWQREVVSTAKRCLDQGLISAWTYAQIARKNNINAF